MDVEQRDGDASGRSAATVERASDRELVVTRLFDAPPRSVFEAWATPELFRRWWTPRSFGLSILSYDADIRTGGSYRLVMRHPSMEQPMAFFGRYIEVTPPTRLVWTNDEDSEGGPVTTATFADREGATLVVVSDLYPSKEALDGAITCGGTSGWREQFEQLDELLADLGTSA